MGWEEHAYPDPERLAQALADALADACRAAIAARGQAWLALAGGRTPLPAYRRLAAAGLAGPVLAIPGDERCVPHADPACNYAQVQQALAADPAIRVLPLTRADGAPQPSLAQARALLAAHPQPFDAVVLGMGADGHFASLFPGAGHLAEGLDPQGRADVLALLPDPLPPEAPFARLSLTLARLRRAQALHLVVTGQDKRAVLRRAQAADRADPALPVTALLHAAGAGAPPLHIHWSP
jgi:6-phosphogluconolactonase